MRDRPHANRREKPQHSLRLFPCANHIPRNLSLQSLKGSQRGISSAPTRSAHRASTDSQKRASWACALEVPQRSRQVAASSAKVAGQTAPALCLLRGDGRKTGTTPVLPASPTGTHFRRLAISHAPGRLASGRLGAGRASSRPEHDADQNGIDSSASALSYTFGLPLMTWAPAGHLKPLMRFLSS